MSKYISNNQKCVKIGLALSGGGTRAIAFHLGCLRALHDRGILKKIDKLSTVSGGSIIGAMYAYSSDSFDQFDKRVVNLLTRGLKKGILRNVFLSWETPAILLTNLTCSVIAFFFEVLSLIPRFKKSNNKWRLNAPFRRYYSSSTAFSSFLQKNIFGNSSVRNVMRGNFDMIINATELTTQTAIRFTSNKSWTWRYGNIIEDVLVSKAVAASASYPVIFPAFDEKFLFEKNGKISKRRVIITDGGVYDNLGTSIFFSNNPNSQSEKVEFIIACIAGHGLPDGTARPYSWFTRMTKSLNTTHKQTENMMKNIIHNKLNNQEIQGFIMPFLGQLDENLAFTPSDLITKEMVSGFSTNFRAMKSQDIELIAKRGEQLTNILLDTYYPDL